MLSHILSIHWECMDWWSRRHFFRKYKSAQEASSFEYASK